MSFGIEEGSIESLIGPNGAGKTSLFNCLTGFYRAQEGDILFEGKSVMKLKPHKITALGMARTFQNLRLLKPDCNGKHYVGMHCRTSAGVAGAVFRPPSQRAEEKRIREVALECMDFVGILDKRTGWQEFALR